MACWASQFDVVEIEIEMTRWGETIREGEKKKKKRRVNVVQAPNVSCWLKVLWDLFLYFEYKWKIYLTFWFIFFQLVCVWQKLFLPTYFTIQFIFATIHGPTALFGTIHGFHYTISINFYLYLQYFQQKIFNFSKINGSQTQIPFFFF